MRVLSFLLSVIFIVNLILLSCSPDQKYFPDNHWIIEPGSQPMIIAHGGAKLLFPENTILAFDSAVAMGVDVLEMDLRLTKDEIIVTHHDMEIDSTSNGNGNIKDITYNELKNLNFAYRFKALDNTYPYQAIQVEIATLEDLFKKYPTTKMIIEIKDEGDWGKKAADEVKFLVETYNMTQNVIVASFHDEITQYFLSITEGKIPVSASQKQATKFALTAKSLTGFTFYPEEVALQLPMKSSGLNLGTKRIINSAHNHNMAIHYWTINEKEDMRDLIEKGADGIITDRPDIMKELLKEMGW